MYNRILQCIVSCFIFVPQLVLGQMPTGGWELVKQENGIAVYTAPSPSGYKRIRVSASLEGTLSEVKALFRNIALENQWVYGTTQAHLIKKTDDDHLLYYSETSLPWPIHNRDVAIWMNIQEGTDRQTLTITQDAAAGMAPPGRNTVRVDMLKANWKFQQTGKAAMHVDYDLDLEPGGSLPAWAVNLFIAKGPFETFTRLREMVRGQAAAVGR